MTNKALILYSSKTGNTEKVAMRFKQTFEKKGWECDIFKVDKKTVNTLSIDYKNYDFLCVGSYLWASMPSEEILDIMRNNSQSIHWLVLQASPRGEPPKEKMEFNEDKGVEMMAKTTKSEAEAQGHRKVIPGPRKGIVFVTYAGAHRGPLEAEPGLAMLHLEMEHLQLFKCIGRFACPGKQYNFPTPEFWHGDTLHRPDERDLMKAEIFLEEKIEEPYE